MLSSAKTVEFCLQILGSTALLTLISGYFDAVLGSDQQSTMRQGLQDLRNAIEARDWRAVRLWFITASERYFASIFGDALVSWRVFTITFAYTSIIVLLGLTNRA